MDSAIDPTTYEQVEEFQRALDAMSEFYQQRAYTAGMMRARQEWDALHTVHPPQVDGLRHGAKRIVAFAVLATGIGLYLINNPGINPLDLLPHQNGPTPSGFSGNASLRK